jgi:hypothetical protein
VRLGGLEMGSRSAILGFALLAVLYAAPPADGADREGIHHRQGDRQSLARFEGGWIDLATGWGPARACLVVSGRSVECFRSALDMSQREAALFIPDVNCSSPLKLYNLINRGGTMVSIYARGLWINLSTYGFDNMTSSYAVGACAAELAALSGGGGAHYSGCLNAWCVENSMSFGWNNITSSVYLH